MNLVEQAAPSVHRPNRGIDVLLDAGRLSELVGRPVRATRLRHKPGLSSIAALVAPVEGQAPGTEEFVGWVQVGFPEHRDKMANAVRRAGRRRRRLITGREDGLWLIGGAMDCDPGLTRGLTRVADSIGPLSAALRTRAATVLRYNPNRRMVLARVRDGSPVEVIRVTAHKTDAGLGLLTRLRGEQVPVLLPVSASVRSRVSRWPWVGRGALDRLGSGHENVAATAGSVLATLHRCRLERHETWHPAQEIHRLGVVLRDLRALDPHLADDAERLTVRLLKRLASDSGATVLTHGDFSADQVLCTTDDQVVLTDFDRCEPAPGAADLGSFAAAELVAGTGTGVVPAAELPLTSALLNGYAESSVVDPDAIQTWTARALLLRVLEPLRFGEPEWRGGIAARLHQIEQVLR